MSAVSQESVPARLRRQWRLTTAVAGASTVVAAIAVGSAFQPTAGGRWLAAAAPVVAYQVWFLYRYLERNHTSHTNETSRPGQTERTDHTNQPNETGSPAKANASVVVSPALGLANAVTLGRGWLYAVVAGFLLVVPPPGSVWRWVPFCLYGAGAALDAVDGFLARTVGQETELGTKLDMAFDTLGFLVAPLVGVVWGRLPVWYLSISAARYLFKLGRGWRRRGGKPVYDLPDSRVRRPLAGLQMAFITVALCPLVPVSVVWPAAAAVVTPSLVVFGRDYLVVAGYLGHGDVREGEQADEREHGRA